MPSTPAPQLDPAMTAFAAASALFAAGGPFALDRNPALLLEPDGGVAVANAAASPLVVLLVGRVPTDLATAIANARDGQPSRIAAVEVMGPDGKPQSLDLT